MTKSKNKWGFLAPTREEADKMEKKYSVHFTPLIDYMKVIFPDVDDWAYAENDHYELVLVSNIGKKIISITDSFVDKPQPCSKIKLSDLQGYDFYRSVDYHYAQKHKNNPLEFAVIHKYNLQSFRNSQLYDDMLEKKLIPSVRGLA